MKADLGRIVAQVITGVGFLGAGTIVFDKGSVKGLTTATTIWVVACIGLAIGLGYYQIAIISTTGISFVVIGLKQFEINARNRKFSLNLDIIYDSSNDSFIETTAKLFNRRIICWNTVGILLF
jgi:putative Mg2+ transporter-C (MgtC) family protein